MVLDAFRDGGGKTFDLGRVVFFGDGVFDKVDADLRITCCDLTLGLRTAPETVRLRTGVGTDNSLGVADEGGIGDLGGIDCEDGRRCGVDLMFWSCWIRGFRRGCLDEDSETGVGDFVLKGQLVKSQFESDGR